MSDDYNRDFRRYNAGAPTDIHSQGAQAALYAKQERERMARAQAEAQAAQQSAAAQRNVMVLPGRSGASSGDTLSFVSFLVATAAFWYVWSYFDNWLLGLIAGAVAWRFTESKLGQVLVKFLLVLVGLGLMWFFMELSKTFR